MQALPAAVSFDCWNTLVYEADWETAHALRVAALERAVRAAGFEGTAEKVRNAFDSAWGRHMEDWERAEASGAPEIAARALADLGLDPTGDVCGPLVRDFEEASHSGGVLEVDGAAETLQGLVRAGVRCALVCDTGLTPGRVVRQHLDRLGLLRWLEVQVFSDESRHPKPHPQAFRAALEPLGAAASEAIHVGDLRRTDVAGARGIGMGTVRIRARYDDLSDLPEADRVADTHVELRQILGLAGR